MWGIDKQFRKKREVKELQKQAQACRYVHLRRNRVQQGKEKQPSLWERKSCIQLQSVENTIRNKVEGEKQAEKGNRNPKVAEDQNTNPS